MGDWKGGEGFEGRWGIGDWKGDSKRIKAGEEEPPCIQGAGEGGYWESWDGGKGVNPPVTLL